MMGPLTADRLREVVVYDPASGILRWRVTVNSRALAGNAAGHSSKNGYRWVRLDGVQYSAHRLAWLYVYGDWPTGELDHRNGDPGDNRISNLREATRSQNEQNKSRAQRNNKSGFLGVAPHRRRWKAQIVIGGNSRFLGAFDTPREASVAYLAAKRDLHPFWEAS